LLDCTVSMAKWIERAKQTLQEIISNVVNSCDDKLQIRICFVGYRDHGLKERFTIHNFSCNIIEIRDFISNVKAHT
jgi:hypothetical protein